MSIITSLSAYYKLDGNPYASFGINNGANSVGMSYGAGIINQGAVFNGSNASIDIPDSTDFTFGTADFGISFWFKRNALGVRQSILAQGNASGAWSTISVFMELTASDYLSANVVNGSTPVVITDTTTITDTNWHHCVLTRSGTNFYLYVDGVLKTTVVSSISVNDSTGEMSFGKLGSYTGGLYYSGSLDEIGFWKQSLVPYVSDLYNSGAGLAYPFDASSGNINYLIVGGGGQGGCSNGGTSGGGGGAGGLITGLVPLAGVGTYPVVVGLGGQVNSYLSANGDASTFNGLIAVGGGRGRYYNDNLAPVPTGGSGGGGGGWTVFNIADSGTIGQGTNGGNGYASTSNPTGPSGGGGGSLTNGLIYSVWDGGAGGAGTLSSITGTPTYYAAGGGGAGGNPSTGGVGGLGGNGIGGNGGTSTIGTGVGAPGVANTGSGGGGNAIAGGVGVGAYGGSGIVVLSYTTGSLNATGGIVTTSGGNTIHTFLTSGNFTILGINSNFLSMFDN
jgi:hypothetical protein